MLEAQVSETLAFRPTLTPLITQKKTVLHLLAAKASILQLSICTGTGEHPLKSFRPSSRNNQRKVERIVIKFEVGKFCYNL
jgi:hypothetical protein